MNWAVATYRLNEVVRAFGLPCVIRLTEGYLPDTESEESEEFSQGDVLTINTEMVSEKVAANFMTENGRSGGLDNYGEILVPLKYKGKVKVLKYIKNIDSVQELATYFPRYTKLRENLVVNAGENGMVTLKAGAILELDRITLDSCNNPDELVIRFELMNTILVAALPITSTGKFRTEEDDTEYTIKEAVDRYGLPLDVKFVDDEIKRVYTPDILEDAENVKSITGTLRLNRIVTEHVLVGHYKPVEVVESLESAQLRRRPLIVLPVDNSEIGNIEVNVMAGDKHDNMFNVMNVSHARTMVESCLFVDFAIKPGIKRISDNVSENTYMYANIGLENMSVCTSDHAVDEADDTPPAIPDRPNKLTELPCEPDEYLDMSFTRTTINSGTSGENLPDVPPRRKLRRSKGTNPVKSVLGNKNQHGKSFWSSLKSTMQGQGKPFAKVKPSPHSTPANENNGADDGEVYEEMTGSKANHCTHSSKTPIDDVSEDYATINRMREASGGQIKECDQTSDPEYEEINEKNFPNFIGNRKKATPELEEVKSGKEAYMKPKSSSEHLLPNIHKRRNIRVVEGETLASIVEHCNPVDTESTSVAQFNNNSDYGESVPVTHSTSTDSMKTPGKLFKDLSSEELVERLMVSKLQGIADICKDLTLNGAFFVNVTKEVLKEDMGLKGLQLVIFCKMRDENWVPF